jgi:hypothetical protein
MDSFSKKSERFLRRVAETAELNVTVLASSHYPFLSSETSLSAAQRMVGGLPGGTQRSAVRVGRLAEKLDKLRAADQQTDSCSEVKAEGR